MNVLEILFVTYQTARSILFLTPTGDVADAASGEARGLCDRHGRDAQRPRIRRVGI